MPRPDAADRRARVRNTPYEIRSSQGRKLPVFMRLAADVTGVEHENELGR